MEIKDKKFLAKLAIETGISVPVGIFVNKAFEAAIPAIKVTSLPVFLVTITGEALTKMAINYAISNTLMDNLVNPMLGFKDDDLDLSFLETVNENSDTEE